MWCQRTLSFSMHFGFILCESRSNSQQSSFSRVHQLFAQRDDNFSIDFKNFISVCSSFLWGGKTFAFALVFSRETARTAGDCRESASHHVDGCLVYARNQKLSSSGGFNMQASIEHRSIPSIFSRSERRDECALRESACARSCGNASPR